MLKKTLDHIKRSPFLQDNLILFVGLFIAGIGGFIYHFIMGRLLGPADYGALGALLSVVYIFLIILNTLQMGIARITTHLIIDKTKQKLHYFFKKIRKAFIYIGLIFLGIYLITLSPLISSYLHVSLTSTLVIGFALFFIFLLSIPRGIMQGSQLFFLLSSNNLLESFVKLASGILFVLVGYGVAGAIGAIVFGYAIAFFVGIYHFRSFSKAKEQSFHFMKQLRDYSLYLGLVLTSLTFYFTADVLIVKHFFDEVQAGYYASLAILSKVLFFGSSSIGQVMFPKVVSLHAEGKPHKHLFYKSSLLAFIFLFPVLFAYFVFPTLIINILFGAQFLDIAPLLGLFGLYMFIFCFIYLFSYYFVSLGSSWPFLGLLFFFNFLEIYLLYAFHDSLSQVITLLISLSLIFLVILYGKFLRTKDA